MPTGDPECADDVKLVKHIKYTIGDRAESGGGELETGLFEVEGELPVGVAADAHIEDSGGIRTAREEYDADSILPVM